MSLRVSAVRRYWREHAQRCGEETHGTFANDFGMPRFSG